MMNAKELIKALSDVPEHYLVKIDELLSGWLVCYNPDFKFPPSEETVHSHGINLNYVKEGERA